MADKLRPDELQAFKAAFDMFDKNGDGTISTKVRFSFQLKSFFFEDFFYFPTKENAKI